MDFIHTIKFKFTVWYLLILTLLLAGLSVGVYAYLSRTLQESFDQTLIVRTEQLKNMRDVFESMSQGRFEERLGEVVVLYYERDGEMYAISRRDVKIPLDNALVQDAAKGENGFQTVMVDGVGEMRFHIVPFRSARPLRGPPSPGASRPGPPMPDFGSQSAALAVGRPVADAEQALDGLVRTLIIAVPLTLLVAGAGGMFLADRALKPVGQIANTARRIQETDLSRRITVSTRDELGRLGSTLNDMIERLEKAFKRQREFTGDASHELRTPLSLIQAEATLALQRARSPEEYQKSLESIAEEAEHMSRIIEQLLFLARADSGSERIAFDEINVADLLREVGADMEALSRDKGVALAMRLDVPAVVRGNEGLLRRLFLNLVDNAVRYTPEGGKVSIASDTAGDEALVSVSDTGIGIPPEHLPHIFERFYRVDKARSRSDGGSGLGLAICKQVVDLHGGRIEVDSKEGQGSTFKVFVPLLRKADMAQSSPSRGS